MVAKSIIMKQKLTDRQKHMLSVMVFLVKLLILSIPIYMVLFFNIPLHPLQDVVIEQSLFVFRATGYDAVRDGYLFNINNDFTFGISEDCTPWKSIWLLCSLMIATSGILWGRRFIGMAIGALILWIENIARIFLIVWVEQNFGLNAAMFIHNYLWRLLLVSIVLSIWLSWFYSIGKRHRERADGKRT